MDLSTEGFSQLNEFLHGVDKIFVFIIEILIYLFGIIGVVVLSIAVIKAFVAYLQHKPNSEMHSILARGMQLSLQFLLSCEILHTIISSSWEGILIVGGIILLRFALNFTIFWETRTHEHEESRKQGDEHVKKNEAA